MHCLHYKKIRNNLKVHLRTCVMYHGAFEKNQLSLCAAPRHGMKETEKQSNAAVLDGSLSSWDRSFRTPK
jgi:hypothetical protein